MGDAHKRDEDVGASSGASPPAKETGERPDLDELKGGVRNAAKKPDTTGHLVWMVVVIFLYSLLGGMMSGAVAAWLSLTGDDGIAQARNFTPFLLNLAEVYNGQQSFTSGLTWVGGAIVLILCLYSLFKRYGAAWIAYVIGLLVIGFIVIFFSWMNESRSADLLVVLENWQTYSYHIILGGVLVALLGIWIGTRFSIVKALILFLLGVFVLFEVQYSHLAGEMVESASEYAVFTTPQIGFVYNFTTELVNGILLLGGLLLLMEGLAYYGGKVTIKGLVFMLVVVAVPAVYFLWEADSLGSFITTETYATRVGGGVASFFQRTSQDSEELYARYAYVLGTRGTHKVELSIQPRLRERLLGQAKRSETAPLSPATGEELDWLQRGDLSRVSENADIEWWRWLISVARASKTVNSSKIDRYAVPYFRLGLYDAETVDDLIWELEHSRLKLSKLHFESIRQLVHLGEFIRAEEMLEIAEEEVKALEMYEFLDTGDYRQSLENLKSEIEVARKAGPGRFKLWVKVLNDGMPVWYALVGLQVIDHELGNVEGEEAPPAGAGEVLTKLIRADASGNVSFDSYIGGHYRLILLKNSLDEREPPFPGDCKIEGFPEVFEAGNEYHVTIHF